MLTVETISFLKDLFNLSVVMVAAFAFIYAVNRGGRLLRKHMDESDESFERKVFEPKK